MPPQSLGYGGIHPALHEIRGIRTARMIQVGEKVGQGAPQDMPHATELLVPVPALLGLLREDLLILLFPDRMEHPPFIPLRGRFDVLQVVYQVKYHSPRLGLRVPGEIFGDQKNHVEMAPLEGGIGPPLLHEVRHAFVAVGHDHFRRMREVHEEAVPGAVPFILGEPPEDIILFADRDEDAALPTLDVFSIHDERLRAEVWRNGTYGIPPEERNEGLGEGASREAEFTGYVRLALDTREPGDQMVADMPSSHVRTTEHF